MNEIATPQSAESCAGENAVKRTAVPQSTSVRAWVEQQQLRAFLDISKQLGLGQDADAAYRRMVKPLIPLSVIEPAESARLNESVAAMYRKYFRRELPTRYEDPNYYGIMLLLLDQALAGLLSIRRPLPSAPFVATIPSGEVDARVIPRDKSIERWVILFEQGLFQYLGDFALLVGWAVPPFSEAELVDDSALARHRGPYTMPFDASSNFMAALGSYLTSGTPYVATPVPKPYFNGRLCGALMSKMRAFVMAHELAHIAMNHIEDARTDKSASWAREYEADALATYALCETSTADGTSWGLTFWACDLALSAIRILDEAIALLHFGFIPSWTSRSHPDGLSRQRRLREIITLGEMGGSSRSAVRYFAKQALSLIGFRPPPDLSLIRDPPIRDMEAEFAAHVPVSGFAAATEACSMTDAIVGGLWRFAAPMLQLERLNGKKPAAMWQKRLAKRFAAP